MSNLNKAMLIGRVGKDPEIVTVQSGDKVAKFSLATSEQWKDKAGNKQESTEWHNIVLWRGLTEIFEKYVHKGDLLYIEGKITTRAWEDKDGNKRYTTEIVADRMQMLGGKKSEQAHPEPNQKPEAVSDPYAKAPEPGAVPEPVDDLPF